MIVLLSIGSWHPTAHACTLARAHCARRQGPRKRARAQAALARCSLPMRAPTRPRRDPSLFLPRAGSPQREMSSAVAHALPPSILALFAPRVPVEFKPPPEKRKMLNYTTIAQFVQHFEE